MLDKIPRPRVKYEVDWFQKYANKYWVGHYRRLNESNPQSTAAQALIQDLASLLIAHKTSFEYWCAWRR